jgi:hypothetical protein
MSEAEDVVLLFDPASLANAVIGSRGLARGAAQTIVVDLTD